MARLGISAFTDRSAARSCSAREYDAMATGETRDNLSSMGQLKTDTLDRASARTESNQSKKNN